MEGTTKRNEGIDLLKALCMIAVVGLHSQRSTATGIVNNEILYYLSRFAMPCFFMVNGYLILCKKSFSVEYYKKKMLNMLRVLLSGGGLAFVYTLVFLGEGIRRAVYNALKCILGYYVIPFWWIYTFAIVYTILLFAFDFIKLHIKEIVLALVSICLCVDFISLFLIFTHDGYFVQALVSQRFRLWTWFMYFCMGYFMGTTATFAHPKKSWLVGMLIAVSISVVIVQVLVCEKYLGRINSEYLYDNILIIVWAALIFIILFHWNGTRPKWLKNFCDNCFGVFMLHEFFLEGLHLPERVNGPVQSMILLLGLVLVCWMLTSLLKKLLNRMPYPISKLLDY